MNAQSLDPTCVVLGAGQHAKVVIDTMLANGAFPPIGLLDPNPQFRGTRILGATVLGGEELLDSLIGEGVTHFVMGIGSIGDTSIRRRVYELASMRGLLPRSVIHPRAYCSPTAIIPDGCQCFAGAIVHTEAKLGVNVLVNTGTIVEHDCVVESHVHLATGSRLAGGVWVGTGAHIGVGAVIRQGVRIGARAVVGAGAVVVADVPADTTVAGVPAKELRKQAA